MSRKSVDSGQFFPFVCDTDKAEHLEVNWGITKREWLAGIAMQGLLSSSKVLTVDGKSVEQNQDTIANSAVRCADALLAELEKQ